MKTPQIDRLAASGVRFEQGYATRYLQPFALRLDKGSLSAATGKFLVWRTSFSQRITHQLPSEYLERKELKGYHDWDPEAEDYYSWNIGGKRPYTRRAEPLSGTASLPRSRDRKDAQFPPGRGSAGKHLGGLHQRQRRPPRHLRKQRSAPRGQFSLYEGGIRVPFIISWPGKFAGGNVVENVVSMLDVFPTVCAAAGVEPGFVDGVDLIPLLTGSNPDLEHDLLARDMRAESAVRKGKGKLRTANDRRNAQRQLVDVKCGEFLPDLEIDPGETRDLRYFFPEKFDGLKTHSMDWRNEMTNAGPRENDRTTRREELVLVSLNGTVYLENDASSGQFFGDEARKLRETGFLP